MSSVLLCGYYGFGNLGDELLAANLIDLLQDAGVERDRIALLAASPREASARHGVACYDRWKLPQVRRALAKHDTLLLGGGGLFQDSTSVRSCVYYWGVVRLAAFMGKTPWALGQSIGPLHTNAGRWFARDALARCVYLGVRDAVSFETARAFGLDPELAPDLAFALPYAGSDKKGAAILVNLRPYGDNRLPLEAARAIAAHAKKNATPLLGIALSESDRALMQEYRESGVLPLDDLIPIDDAGAFARHAEMATGAFGMRLHFLILALRSSLPCACAPYDPKVDALAEDWNLPKWSPGGEIHFSAPSDPAKWRACREELRTLFQRPALAKIMKITEKISRKTSRS